MAPRGGRRIGVMAGVGGTRVGGSLRQPPRGHRPRVGVTRISPSRIRSTSFRSPDSERNPDGRQEDHPSPSVGPTEPPVRHANFVSLPPHGVSKETKLGSGGEPQSAGGVGDSFRPWFDARRHLGDLWWHDRTVLRAVVPVSKPGRLKPGRRCPWRRRAAAPWSRRPGRNRPRRRPGRPTARRTRRRRRRR